MAITRLWEAGWELGTIKEGDAQNGTAPDTASTKAFSGTYSLRLTSSTGNYGNNITSTTELRAHFFINHIGARSESNLFYFVAADATVYRVYWDETTNELRIAFDGVDRATANANTVGFAVQDQWHSCGMALKIDGSAGWFNFYFENSETLSFSGNTGSSGITQALFGGRWDNFAYIDDIYVDDTTGEAAAAPPKKKFLWSPASGNGANSDWTGSDGDSTDNYLHVDERPPDDDTTYVAATSTGLTDTYAHSGVTVPDGFVLTAAIVKANANRAGGSEEMELIATDGTNTTTGSAQAPGSDYTVLRERMATQPDSSGWNETDFNATEIGFNSTGTF